MHRKVDPPARGLFAQAGVEPWHELRLRSPTPFVDLGACLFLVAVIGSILNWLCPQ